jgi:hypothetical protein
MTLFSCCFALSAAVSRNIILPLSKEGHDSMMLQAAAIIISIIISAIIIIDRAFCRSALHKLR